MPDTPLGDNAWNYINTTTSGHRLILEMRTWCARKISSVHNTISGRVWVPQVLLQCSLSAVVYDVLFIGVSVSDGYIGSIANGKRGSCKTDSSPLSSCAGLVALPQSTRAHESRIFWCFCRTDLERSCWLPWSPRVTGTWWIQWCGSLMACFGSVVSELLSIVT